MRRAVVGRIELASRSTVDLIVAMREVSAAKEFS
jgi:hypothetical protein